MSNALQTQAPDQAFLSDDDESTPKDLDQRHLRRIKLMQQLFAATFNQGTIEPQEIPGLDPFVLELLDHQTEIDTLIQAAASERPLHDINKVDLAVLRLIMFESQQTKAPKKVLINEAIELAKAFGTESSPRFINGVLGKLLIASTEEADEA